MPKLKTHSGASKRFQLTGNKKLKRRTAFSSHLLEKKSPKRKRDFTTFDDVAKGDQKNIRKLIKA